MNLDKLSDLLWRIVGIALAGLFLLGIAAMLIGGGIGFFKYRQHHVDGVQVTGTKEDSKPDALKVTVQYELPLPVEGVEHFIIPVTLEKKKLGEAREDLRSEKSSSDYSSRSASYGGYYYGGPYYNFLFIDKKTGETKLLLQDKGFIGEIYFPDTKFNPKEENKAPPNFLLYKIATVDTNQDGVLNEKDALAGYVSHPDGTHLVRVTPENTQMGWWRYDAAAKTLFVEVIHDLNQDKKFNWDDPKTVVAVNALDPKVGTEIVAQNIKAKVDAILKQ